ncbi:cell division protein ZapE [Paraburkholderia caledonica]
MNVTEYLKAELQKRGCEADTAQLSAAAHLQRCSQEWADYEAHRSNPLRRFVFHPDPPRGIYLWGGVGRGKTFLMDCFFALAPVQAKARVHFHEFMHDVHTELQALKGEADPLDTLAKHIALRSRLICFDEFHISDVADAMILYRLFERLFAEGVQLVLTSNYEPDGLYPDGLNRERFLPAIDLLKAKLDVINVDAGVDYRLRTLSQVRMYLSPRTPENDRRFRDAFSKLSSAPEDDQTLRVAGREIRAVNRAGDLAWFDFATLCGGMRSQDDYLYLVSRFHTMMLSDVPQMSSDDDAAIRRFIWLVDIIYDHRVKLLVYADVALEHLCPDGRVEIDFERTMSRLFEMQSRQYLESGRRAPVR